MTQEWGASRAAVAMRGLLAGSGYYRRTWERHSRRRIGPEELNQAAIAEVVATYLWDSGERADDALSPRILKDRVSRALSGRVFSPETLRWFIDAFEMTPRDAALLWERLLGASPGSVTAVRGSLPVDSVDLPASLHETVSLHELHYLGVDGLPREHRTVQVVRARTEGLDTYPYLFDTNAAAVEVIRGGKAGPMRRYTDDLYGVEIRLTEPLAEGGTSSLEYRTLFTYRAPPPPEFRRAARRRVQNVDVRVQFDSRKLPRRLEWAQWDHFRPDAVAVRTESVALDSECAAHRFVATLERAAVGFRWEW